MAKNPQFFLGDKQEDITYSQGYMQKIAIASGDYTLEDSSIITEDVSEALASNVTMMKSVTLGPNANILKMVKKGQHIKTGQELIVFEHSFDDAEANKLLDSLDDDFTEFVEGIGQDSVQSKFTGEVVDIKIFYNVDLEEMSESMRTIIQNYNKDVNRRKKIAEANNNHSIIFPPTEKIDNYKINGKDVQGVIIEFYVRHRDTMGVGDKVLYGTAIKTIVSDVIKKGEEPYSEYHKDENLAAVVSGLSIVSRMTTDTFNMLYTNKLIIELKNKCKEIWDS